MSNAPRITRTLHETTLMLVEALADDPLDPRVRRVAGVLVQLADYIDRSSVRKTTLERRGYDAESAHRQAADDQMHGPILADIEAEIVRLRSNVVHIEDARARLRGPQKQTGA